MQDELNVFATRVDKPAVGVLPPGEQVTKADLLIAMSHMGQEQLKLNLKGMNLTDLNSNLV